LVQSIKTYIDSAKAIRDAINKNLKSEKWVEVSAFPESPLIYCRDLRNNLAKEIKALRKQDITRQIKQLQEELQLLKDRQQLSQNLSSIEEAVLNLKWTDKAQEPKRNLNPQRVTLKQKALANELVGKGFMEKFKEECEILGLNNPPLKINITGSDAITRRNLAIGRGDVTLALPSEVLSEGEQTAVAMADFLTEIALNNSPIGIIFDDPVNSMDHLRKEKIAKRLVSEASKRQVIIFTHDVIFTHHLAEEAVKLGVDKIQFKACTISVGSDRVPGYVDKMVFPHVYYEKETEKLAETHLTEAKHLTGDSQKDKLVLGCGALRAAYEHLIQEQIFNDVVKRWREPIRATSLSQVYFNPEINDSIVEHFEKLSQYVDSHFHSREFQEAPLTTDFLEEEIRTFQEIKKKYSQEADKYRKEKSTKKKVFS
jgi:energy-coupling factor transporter ATP-binding protein EcfA2